MEVGAAAAAASAGGVGMGLFSYNRANYMFDQKNHYARFTAGLNMAIAQTGMYKADIAQLTELTVTRQDCYHGIAAMGLTILTAIYCPGRLGLHSSPPPGWLMGLAFVNLAGCYLFFGLALWLAMHASMRADTAATHMLTRFVRLPIPSQGMLDKARKFLSSFEEQPLKEVFRVPFTRHDRPGAGKEGGFNEGRDIDTDALARARHGFDVPAWYKKEKALDNTNTSETIGSMMPLDGRGSAPEHFEAYRELQQEWFPYDVYARLSIFLAFMHLIHCWTYMQIGHQLQETRALFACAIVILPMFVLQQCILTLDIIPSSVPLHRIGPFALWFAFVAAVIEYKRWFTVEAQAIGFLFVYIAYGIHIIYTFSLLRLCCPSSDAPVVAESPGASWWPGEWRLPCAFQHAIWLVAPPKQLEDGQNDIVGELREAQLGSESSATSCALPSGKDKRADVHRALGRQGESPAWFSVKVGLLSLSIAWIFMTFGFTIEILNQGTAHPSLLKAPGVPNNARDPRYRPAKPGGDEPTEVGTGGVMAGPAKGVHTEKQHRRLQSTLDSNLDHRDVADKLFGLLPYLQTLSLTGEVLVEPHHALGMAPVKRTLSEVAVEWPAFFEPQILVSDTSSGTLVTLVLSRQGRGVLVDLMSGVTMQQLVLDGVASYGSIISASWDSLGLLLVTSVGSVLECIGSAGVDGRWRCSAISSSQLPVGRAAAISRAPDGGVQAAVVFGGERAVAFFSQTGHGSWLPTGEVHTDMDVAILTFSPNLGSLMLASADGMLARLSKRDGSIAMSMPEESKGLAWVGMCGLGGSQVASLAVGKTAAQKVFIHEV